MFSITTTNYSDCHPKWEWYTGIYTFTTTVCITI